MPLFPSGMKQQAPSKLQPLTLRSFGGGWNAVDDDISMKPNYAVTLKNFRRTGSGGQQLRYGTNWLADTHTIISGNIIDVTYFAGFLIAVAQSGEIAKISDAGVVTAIWNNTIAATRPGAPTGWTSIFTTVQFVAIKDELAIHNGIDKPLIVDNTVTVNYLQDEATGSNVNVPIGKYACVAANYHCIMGIPGAPTTVVIGAKGTSGTYPGDPPPNDAISIDVGAYAPSGAASIRGCIGFRNFLVVFFPKQALLITLGVYDSDGNHTPQFPDTLPQCGLLGHRCIVPVDTDIRFAGLDGLGSGSRNLYTGSIDNKFLSDRVEPAYRSVIGSLTDDEHVTDCFVVYDSLARDTIIFNPSGRVLVYTANNQLQYRAWSEFDGMNWTCGCASFLGRVFLASGTRIFQLGNGTFTGEKYAADRLNDRDKNYSINTVYMIGDLVRDTVTNTTYLCAIDNMSAAATFALERSNNPSFWALYDGIALDFEMELPWLDSANPMTVKRNSFLSIATKGTSEFTFEVYVDNLYKDIDGNVLYDPALSIALIGNDVSGFGYDPGPLGGGRRSRDPRLIGFPVKFKTIKPRIYGSTKKPLQILQISFLYAKGTYKR